MPDVDIFEFQGLVKLAQLGREVWEKLCKENNITSEYRVFHLLNSDDEIFLKRNISGFLKKNPNVRVVYLIPYKKEFYECNDITITKNESEALLQYYLLMKFSTNYIVASLEYPSTRRGRGFLEKGLTYEEVFCLMILDMSLE